MRARLVRRQDLGGSEGALTAGNYDAIQEAVGRLKGFIDRLDG